MTEQDTLPAQLDDEQLDRLEALLDDPALEEAMRLDESRAICAPRSPARNPFPKRIGWIDILGSEEALDSAAGQRSRRHHAPFAAGARSRPWPPANPPVLLLYPKDEAKTARATTYPGARPIWRASTAEAEDWFEYLRRR
jgi:uncharacterized protein